VRAGSFFHDFLLAEHNRQEAGMKTRELIDLIPTSYDRITAALRARKLDPPQKDASGDFNWTAADVRALRHALATDRRLKSHRKVMAHV
jgi:hypothetical protein